MPPTIALAETGIIPVEELETHGSDESRLPMSAMASYTPGMEIAGGSLGHGLTVATGMGLGLRHLGNPARVYNLLSDGELDEGSTWEAALQAAHHGLDNVTAIVDVNALQADGPTEGILRTEPVLDKWQAFGWKALRVDGNDIAALVDAFATPAPEAVPAAPKKKRLTTSAMIASFADPGQKTSSAPFGHALARLAEERPEIVGLSADLAKYTDMHIFRDAHPQRFFQMGMAEQAMLGAAVGMAEVGLVPFASTYSVFATRRAYDFLCLDIAEPNLNVNVVGALPGLTTGYGPSHQATEDLAILRGCPNLTIVDPCDSVDIEQSVPQLAAHAGPTYLRLLRGQVPTVLDEYDYRFELGKAAELRTGRDVVLISTGLMTMRALHAAARLEADHVDVAVLHVPTIKPLDREAILRVARTDRLVVTLENHTVIGGLSEAVASTIAFAGVGTPVVPIALPDEFHRCRSCRTRRRSPASRRSTRGRADKTQSSIVVAPHKPSTRAIPGTSCQRTMQRRSKAPKL